MIAAKQSDRETQYRPQAGKTLRDALRNFIAREFPRLGGPWVIEMFVDKLLQCVDKYQIGREQLKPGQTLWPAIAIDEHPGYHKPTYAMRQVPVVLTLVNQQDITDLRQDGEWTTILQRAMVRAANEAYAQGGVLSSSDLSVLFHRSHSRVAELIRRYEIETGETVPRRGNIHDIGRTVTHKRIICRKAYLEGKPSHVIARETCHSPEAVDRYVLDFARVHFATVRCGMTIDEAAFAIQRPRFLIEEYVKLIAEFGLDAHQVYDRSGMQLEMCNGRIEPVLQAEAAALPIPELELAQGQALINAERREQASMTG
jgi:hypothetical protein